MDTVEGELERRKDIWAALLADGSPDGVAPGRLRELRLYGGAQGIWFDKAVTASVSPDGVGVTVSVLHTGHHYADDLMPDGLVYHYPETARPVSRDAAEVQATKNANSLDLPVYVVTHSPTHPGHRDVRVATVDDWDDENRIFLLSFAADPDSAKSTPAPDPADGTPFALTEEKPATTTTAKARPNQARFKFQCLHRYGGVCAVCDIAVLDLLDAAHLCPKNADGSDDPRNGLIFCPTHHRAFDAGLFAIDPASLDVKIAGSTDATKLMVTKGTLHLPKPPHADALAWRWSRWQPSY